MTNIIKGGLDIEQRERGATNSSWTINPTTNKWCSTWDKLLALALLYTAIVTPYEVAFLVPQIDALFCVNQLVNFLFLVDVVLQFFLHYQLPKNLGSEWIRDHNMIVKNYLRGSFAMDLISSMPFSAMSLEIPALSSLSIVRLLRLLRLLKLMRIFRTSRLIQRYRAQIDWSFGFLNLTKFVIGMLVCAHWIACVWGWIGNNDDRLENSWMSTYIHCEDEICDDDLASWNIEEPTNQYIISLYFAVMTLTTVGYGDVTPHNMTEYALVTITMFGGGFLWAFIIGAVCGAVSNMDMKKVEYQQKFDQINFMLADLAVHDQLAIRIRSYLLQCENRERRTSYSYLMSELSPALQAEFCEDVSASRLNSVPFFFKRTVAFRLAVFKKLQCEVYAPREYLTNVATLHIIVNQGLVSKDGQLLNKGQSFDHDFILESWNPLAHTPGIAFTFVEVDTLTRHQMREICSIFPYEKSAITWARIQFALLREAHKRQLDSLTFREQQKERGMSVQEEPTFSSRTKRGKTISSMDATSLVSDLPVLTPSSTSFLQKHNPGYTQFTVDESGRYGNQDDTETPADEIAAIERLDKLETTTEHLSKNMDAIVDKLDLVLSRTQGNKSVGETSI